MIDSDLPVVGCRATTLSILRKSLSRCKRDDLKFLGEKKILPLETAIDEQSVCKCHK